jgi:hypothetical protein
MKQLTGHCCAANNSAAWIHILQLCPLQRVIEMRPRDGDRRNAAFRKPFDG